jgi:hypothetical protein
MPEMVKLLPEPQGSANQRPAVTGKSEKSSGEYSLLKVRLAPDLAAARSHR